MEDSIESCIVPHCAVSEILFCLNDISHNKDCVSKTGGFSKLALMCGSKRPTGGKMIKILKELNDDISQAMVTGKVKNLARHHCAIKKLQGFPMVT